MGEKKIKVLSEADDDWFVYMAEILNHDEHSDVRTIPEHNRYLFTYGKPGGPDGLAA